MITLNQTKNYLQIANSGYDSFLSEIITYSIAHIENYVGYTFLKQKKLIFFKVQADNGYLYQDQSMWAVRWDLKEEALW